jgi:hypothetical protein
VNLIQGEILWFGEIIPHRGGEFLLQALVHIPAMPLPKQPVESMLSVELNAEVQVTLTILLANLKGDSGGRQM